MVHVRAHARPLLESIRLEFHFWHTVAQRGAQQNIMTDWHRLVKGRHTVPRATLPPCLPYLSIEVISSSAVCGLWSEEVF